MAVIITGMDMPKNCTFCEYHANFGCPMGICSKLDDRPDDCPIKSVDELIEKIQNIPNDETTMPIGTYDYVMGAENERKVILKIIKDYCGMEDNNADCN